MAPTQVRMYGPQMGLQYPKDVTRDTARDLSALVGELAREGETIG